MRLTLLLLACGLSHTDTTEPDDTPIAVLTEGGHFAQVGLSDEASSSAWKACSRPGARPPRRPPRCPGGTRSESESQARSGL